MRFNGKVAFCVIVSMVLSPFSGCTHSDGLRGGREPVVLEFSFTVDEEICRLNKYKRTPQFAIWVENIDSGEIRTVCVTAKTARGQWGGKRTRPVSLPYWVSRWNIETQSHGAPTEGRPAAEAVTCPTPKAGFEHQITVPGGGRWRCFIEVNVSGDHNDDFPEKSPDGRRDMHSNGQPSIVYRGEILAVGGESVRPVVVGRTDQFEPVKDLSPDLSGITTAAQLLCDVTVSCRALTQAQ